MAHARPSRSSASFRRSSKVAPTPHNLFLRNRLRSIVAAEPSLSNLAPRLSSYLKHRSSLEAEEACNRGEGAPRDGMKLSHHVPAGLRTWWPVVEFAFAIALLVTVPFELCFLAETPARARALYWCADVFFTTGVLLLLRTTAVTLARPGYKEQQDRNEPLGYRTYAALSLPLDIAAAARTRASVAGDSPPTASERPAPAAATDPASR